MFYHCMVTEDIAIGIAHSSTILVLTSSSIIIIIIQCVRCVSVYEPYRRFSLPFVCRASITTDSDWWIIHHCLHTIATSTYFVVMFLHSSCRLARYVSHILRRKCKLYMSGTLHAWTHKRVLGFQARCRSLRIHQMGSCNDDCWTLVSVLSFFLFLVHWYFVNQTWSSETERATSICETKKVVHKMDELTY